ncbi:cupin domain-containing protein [Caballeronia sp. 15711]|uniref:cupin domain-containing protein n=1 Tax=Caballeronia sp. 15711 TaxID=3391029 RepID=UPI0039E4038D
MSAKADELARKLVRNFDEVEKTAEIRLPLYETLSARLGTNTAAKHLGASIDIVAAGKRSCPYQFHHAQEEMFVILEGDGTLRVAGELIPIKAGDVIFIPPGPEYPHQIINSSEAPLKYLSISTRDDPEVVEYPDSGKYQAIVRGKEGAPLLVIQRKDNSLDYWDDEP